ncbi:hypothetical protein CYMTET_53583 [Cymbomonas tetramitiformis]|uniref:Uncharacterized protein n=1 Tax=Cymbomonas tetramitiformis TaxID=36881 RepID=A0AAE0BGK8_9CHLO|nr:hypothetical protein CYMTET_53583 [Cymbomonas tetramitiformis]
MATDLLLELEWLERVKGHLVTLCGERNKLHVRRGVARELAVYTSKSEECKQLVQSSCGIRPLLEVLLAVRNDKDLESAVIIVIENCATSTGTYKGGLTLCDYDIKGLRPRVLEMPFGGAGLGFCVWAAALLMAHHLVSVREMIQGKTVLELGAGPGLPGLVCHLLGAREVTMSDCVPAIQQSLTYSSHLHTRTRGVEQSGTVHVVHVDWRQEKANYLGEQWQEAPTHKVGAAEGVNAEKVRHDTKKLKLLDPEERFDVIVGSDLLYDIEHSRSLPYAIAQRLHPVTGRCIIVASLRRNDLLNTFSKEVQLAKLQMKVTKLTQADFEQATTGEKKSNMYFDMCAYDHVLCQITSTHTSPPSAPDPDSLPVITTSPTSQKKATKTALATRRSKPPGSDGSFELNNAKEGDSHMPKLPTLTVPHARARENSRERDGINSAFQMRLPASHSEKPIFGVDPHQRGVDDKRGESLLLPHLSRDRSKAPSLNSITKN